MSRGMGTANGAAALYEMREFASFDKGTQRYIRRSLDIGLGRRDAARRWARDAGEVASIRAQVRAYERLPQIRRLIPDDNAIEAMEPLMAFLVSLAAFDLAEGRLICFPSFRFLYERLLGAAIRPWLPAAFCAAAALPHIHPEARGRLLQTVSEAAVTAAGWSSREPAFLPEWVEKIDATVAA